MDQPDNNEQGIFAYDETELEQLAIDAFRVFGTDPERWPDKVEINRSGTTDCNIVGTWDYDREREFYNVPFASLEPGGAPEIGTSADDSGSAV